MSQKILLITSSLSGQGGGAEKQICHHACALKNNGYRVEVLVTNPSRGHWNQFLEKHNIPVNYFSREASTKEPGDFIAELAKAIGRIAPTITITYLYRLFIEVNIAAKQAQVPFVIGAHRELELIDHGFAIPKDLLDQGLQSTDLFVANSLPGSEKLVEFGLDQARVRFVPNGIDIPHLSEPEVTAARRKIGVEDDDFVIGIVANFRPFKSHQTLIQAAPRILNEIPKAKFVIVGNYYQRFLIYYENMLELVEKSEAKAKIRILTGETEASNLIPAFDVGVLCSTHTEGMSNSILEYMAASKPVVASRMGGALELVREGQNGYLYSPGDDLDFAGKLELVARHSPFERHQLGAAGQKWIQERYSWQAVADQWSKIFKSRSHLWGI